MMDKGTKVTLTVGLPLPAPTQEPDGTWTQEIHVHPSSSDAVPDVIVDIFFDKPYLTGAYKIVPNNPPRILSYIVKSVHKGVSSSRFFVVLAELPSETWLLFTFNGITPPIPQSGKY